MRKLENVMVTFKIFIYIFLNADDTLSFVCHSEIYILSILEILQYFKINLNTLEVSPLNFVGRLMLVWKYTAGL